MSGLSCGIVGLPNVGKSTLFNALTKAAAAAANYPFCTIDPNIGIVDVIDPRLQALSDISKSKKLVYAQMTFVDIAGLVKGASKGEGLGNQFLANIRETDAILHVVRCFEDPDVVHVEGKIDPLGDIAVINTELNLADLQMIANIRDRVKKQMKGKKELELQYETLGICEHHLDQGNPLRTLSLSKEAAESISQYRFITSKPVIYAANIGEEDLDRMTNSYVESVKKFATEDGSLVLPICARLEHELSLLSQEEALEYLRELGLTQTGLQRLIKVCFQTLGLITYLTTGEIETRAWTVPKGTPAPEAAGKIHSDIQKGFIRAEVVSFDDMLLYKGRAGAKEHGKARMEGKEYIVQDGDVILFYHN